MHVCSSLIDHSSGDKGTLAAREAEVAALRARVARKVGLAEGLVALTHGMSTCMSKFMHE